MKFHIRMVSKKNKKCGKCKNTGACNGCHGIGCDRCAYSGTCRHCNGESAQYDLKALNNVSSGEYYPTD